MTDPAAQTPLTFGELARYSAALLERHPHLENYRVEMREHLIFAPPSTLTHDDDERVVIFIGVYHQGY